MKGCRDQKVMENRAGRGEMRCKKVAGKEHMEDAVRLNARKGTD